MGKRSGRSRQAPNYGGQQQGMGLGQYAGQTTGLGQQSTGQSPSLGQTIGSGLGAVSTAIQPGLTTVGSQIQRVGGQQPPNMTRSLVNALLRSG